jgi:glycine/D-amino acid oxidase-like deaminating enzyme
MLQRTASPGVRTTVTVYDACGLGQGASGAAAGLLHPFSPKGKLAWMGLQGFAATETLIRAAESALATCAPMGVSVRVVQPLFCLLHGHVWIY